MKFHQEDREDGVSITFLKGILDFQSVREFGHLFEEFQKRDCRKIILDLAEVEFIDSQSLSLIITHAVHVRKQGGDVRVSSVPPRIMRVFELVGMDEVLEFYPDHDLAVRSFGRNR